MAVATVTAGATVPRRTLALAMRRARERADLTIAEAAAQLGASTQTIWRLEQARTASKVATVALLCDIYQVPRDMREALKALATETRSRGWWHVYGDVVAPWFDLYMALEATAQRIRTFETSLVPGIVQSPQYMRAVIHGGRPELSEEEIGERVQLKAQRQRLMRRTVPAPPRLEVIIAEAVLMAQPGAAVMREQVWELMRATEAPHVSVRVLPVARGPHRASGAGAFTVLDFTADEADGDGDQAVPSTVYCENLTGAVYLDKPSQVAAYEAAWQALADLALDDQASLDVLGRRLKELNDEG